MSEEKKKKENKKSGSDSAVYVLNKVINGIVFILIGIGVVFLGLFVFGIRPYMVLSGSMEPKIPVGSLVFVNHNAKFSDLKKDDVITFRAGEVIVTHRVYEVDGDKIITKGDANDEPDSGSVTAQNLVGKDVYVVPKMGRVMEFFQSTIGMVLSAVVIIVLIIGSILTGREDKNDDKKEDAQD